MSIDVISEYIYYRNSCDIQRNDKTSNIT